MTSAQDVEVSVTINSPSQDSFHLDDQILSKHYSSVECFTIIKVCPFKYIE